MRFALALVIVTAVSSAGADNKRIGVVKEAKGNWCRGGEPLHQADEVNWEDDVRYCDRPVVKEHEITISFDSEAAADEARFCSIPGGKERAPASSFERKPPHERTYSCTTPGICDDRAKLWLQGAYCYPEPASGHASTLVSSPNLRGGSVPDTVVESSGDGADLPSELVSTLNGDTINVCRLADERPTDCYQINPTQSSAKVRGAPGLYGIYHLSAPKGPPSALLLVAPAKSQARERWLSVPKPFREDSSPGTVRERRLFLLDLYQSTK